MLPNITPPTGPHVPGKQVLGLDQVRKGTQERRVQALERQNLKFESQLSNPRQVTQPEKQLLHWQNRHTDVT